MLSPDHSGHLVRRWTHDEVTAARHYGRAAHLDADADDFSAVEWATVVAWWGGRCLSCGAAETTVDHVVPLSRGGGNGITNIQPLCGSCNSVKGARTIDYRDPCLLVQLLDLLAV